MSVAEVLPALKGEDRIRQLIEIFIRKGSCLDDKLGGELINLVRNPENLVGMDEVERGNVLGIAEVVRSQIGFW